jgi:hypothetical protein
MGSAFACKDKVGNRIPAGFSVGNRVNHWKEAALLKDIHSILCQVSTSRR